MKDVIVAGGGSFGVRPAGELRLQGVGRRLSRSPGEPPGEAETHRVKSPGTLSAFMTLATTQSGDRRRGTPE